MARLSHDIHRGNLIGEIMMKSQATQKSLDQKQTYWATCEYPLSSKSSPDGYLTIAGNKVHETAIVAWDHVKLGTGNIIGPYACVGTEAQHKTLACKGKVVIGNNNIIREFATIHRSLAFEKSTVIGNDNFLMAGSHVAHDCTLENNIVLCNNASLAGHVHVMDGAFLSLNCSVHQFQVIGAWSIIGMNSCVKKSEIIAPGYKYFVVPAKKICKKTVAIKRNKITPIMLHDAQIRFSKLREN